MRKIGGRIETREAYITTDIDWLGQKKDWKSLRSIGAICTKTETNKGISKEWHYYIASREFTPEELMHHARMEWSVESMHWLLDVHFGEDKCRVEDKTVQSNLNIFRKAAINLIKLYKTRANSKKAISKIMLDCLLEPMHILNIMHEN